jgi:hypothetical protein
MDPGALPLPEGGFCAHAAGKQSAIMASWANRPNRMLEDIAAPLSLVTLYLSIRSRTGLMCEI